MGQQYQTAIVLSAVLCAAACAPTGDDASAPAPTNDPSYIPLAVEANSTSQLGGIALKLRTIPTAVTLSTSSGTLNHSSGATTINDGTYTLVDPDGYTSNGLLSDGVSTLFSTPAQGFTGNYDYARVYSHSYFVASQPYVATGVYGVVTADADMPSQGSATYHGEAQASFSEGTSNFDLNEGTSLVQVDFARASARVDMTGFSAVNRASGATEDIGFDAVRISDMKIAGNQMAGGEIETRNGASSVNVIPDRNQETALARFFGLDNAAVPDEVGGIAYVRSKDKSLTAIFLAD